MTPKQRNKLIFKSVTAEENARLLTENLKLSFKQTGKLQAQDIARIEKLYEQAHSLKQLSTCGQVGDNA